MQILTIRHPSACQHGAVQ